MPNRRNAIYTFIIVCLLGGLLTGRAFFFSLSFILGVLLILALIWSWFAVARITVSRKTRTRRAQVGRTLGEVFQVRNKALLHKLWLEVQDYSDLPGHRVSQVIPLLGGRATYRWYADTECIVRGEFTLGPMGIASGDPFGLFNKERRTSGGLHVIVYPQTLPVSKFDSPANMLSGGEPRRQRSHTITTNAAGVREYAPGDSFNRIHWASSARKDRLMVKEFEIDPLTDVWLLPDFSAHTLIEAQGLIHVNGDGAVLPRNGSIPQSSEEYTVVIAASLANYFVEQKRALGFTAYVPHREVYQPERGHRQLLHILETLAVARSKSPYTLAETMSLETPYMSRGTTVIAITASLDPAWIFELQVLAKKGMRPMAILLDPTTFGGYGDVDSVRSMLRLGKVPSLTISYGDDLSAALSQNSI